MKIPFSEVFADETKNGTKLKTSDYQTSGTYPIIDQGQEFIAGYTDSENGLYTDVPAIIFGDHTRVLKYVDFPFFLGADGAKILKARKAHANYRYLYYALKSVRIPDTGYNRHFKWLKEATVSIPDFQNQEYIVFTLDSISRIISHRKSQLAKLDELVKCRFVEMFGDLSVYEEKPLNDVCSFIDYRGKTPVKTEAGVPLITAKNVGIGVYSYEPREYIDSAIYDSWMTRGFPRVGDILFTTEAPLGHVCRIPEMSGRFSVGQRLIVIQPDALLLDYDFVSFILQSPDFQEKVLQKSTGSTVRGIRSKELIKLTIPIPPLTQQQTFADFVHCIDKLRIVIRQSLDEAQKLFDSLMQEYFD